MRSRLLQIQKPENWLTMRREKLSFQRSIFKLVCLIWKVSETWFDHWKVKIGNFSSKRVSDIHSDQKISNYTHSLSLINFESIKYKLWSRAFHLKKSSGAQDAPHLLSTMTPLGTVMVILMMMAVMMAMMMMMAMMAMMAMVAVMMMVAWTMTKWWISVSCCISNPVTIFAFGSTLVQRVNEIFKDVRAMMMTKTEAIMFDKDTCEKLWWWQI